MTALRVLVSRLLAAVTKAKGDARLNEEIETHLDLLAEDYVRRGLARDEARAAARREFGGVEQVKEVHRDQRGLPMLDALAQDLRYAVRTLRRDPGFATVAILSLGLGIGATTAIFSVFNAVMLRPLPVPEPQQLVILQPRHQGQRWILFNPIFEELRRQQQTLSGMFAVNDEQYLKVTFDGDVASTYVRGSFVSGSYFSVLGVSPARGRLLTEADDELLGASGEAGCSAVVGYSFWTRRFQADPSVLGRTLRARETDCTIVGVAPASFESHQPGYAPDVWLPLRPLTDRKLLASRGMAFFSGVMGRLRPGATLQQAQAELTALYQRIPQGEPPHGTRAANPADLSIALIPSAQGLDGLRRRFSEPLGIILAVVGVVLLIAALNVATLLLARGAARLPELATRAALGAGRGAVYGTVEQRLGALPGVRAASVSWLGLFGGSDLWLVLVDADHPEQRSEGRVDYVSARYFDAVGMQILRGRGFDDRDREGSERVAVVNETLARERFRGDALGRRLALDYTGEQRRPFRIVGVVRDAKYNDLREDRVRPMMWMPLAQAPFRITSVALRVEPGFESAVGRQAEAALTSTDPHLMVRSSTTLSAQVKEKTSRERLLLGLASGFGALAMLLGAVGLYGTLAYAVARRTREIGVRLALGAERRTVLQMILRDALKLVAIALLAGVPLALAAGSSLRAFLFGVTPQDPASLCGACALLAITALVAAYVPARRAAAVDPLVALRCE